ncbi:MAG: ISKra4 family transposase [Ketobacter sp.]|nr:ISKra4 family transposase [Ketobacter sp.]
MELEKELFGKVFDLGKLFILLFLGMREAHWRLTHTPNSNDKWQGPKDRDLGTLFGKVRYWRTYVYRSGSSVYPLDIELGLPLDGFSMLVRGYAAHIATKMSYAQSVAVLSLFLKWSPSQGTIEEMVLGLGRHTQQWFASAPAPEEDGEVLVIQLDSKGTPTATDEELKKRRGKRPPNAHRGSQRHRGRKARNRRGSKQRKKKGDKSKNAKMATIVIMYTLRRSEDGTLEGPLNKTIYASYARKRHAAAIARREADKRGFTKGSGRVVQVVTDGDNDLANYIEELFPEALHTLDVFHATEYLWKAGGCLFKEGSEELEQWVEQQKDALYEGRVAEIIEALADRLAMLPTRGPGTKNRRERLENILTYFSKRTDKMDYKSLREQDLEISSGAVEGAVNYVIAKRFDSGGMRWIKERAEALLQLRCIEANGDWDGFIKFVHDKTIEQTQRTHTSFFLKSNEAEPLPTYGCN